MPADDWKRVGELLVRRRVELNPRYSNRQVFAAERGISYRILSDLERGNRGNYERATIIAAEAAYALAPGSIARAAAGGDLEPLPVRAVSPLAPVPLRPASDGENEDEAAAEAAAEAAYRDLLLRVDPRDVELLQILGRALDPEGHPLPWRRKYTIASQYLREFEAEEQGRREGFGG